MNTDHLFTQSLPELVLCIFLSPLTCEMFVYLRFVCLQTRICDNNADNKLLVGPNQVLISASYLPSANKRKIKAEIRFLTSKAKFVSRCSFEIKTFYESFYVCHANLYSKDPRELLSNGPPFRTPCTPVVKRCIFEKKRGIYQV